MIVQQVIEQQADDAPFGKPYGVVRDGAATEWFCTMSEAWDYRDECVDKGERARVVGCPCVVAAVMADPVPQMTDAQRAAYRDGRPATYPLGWDHI